jgi:dUTP pyrophosphatase
MLPTLLRATVAGVLEVPLLAVDPELPMPRYAREGDAAVDLLSRIDAHLQPGGGRLLLPTGVALAVPPGHAGLVLPRSGLALRHGVTCLNAPGLIDAGFRGEIEVLLLNTDPQHGYDIFRGDRIAQLLVVEVDKVRFVPVATLDVSERGGGGFGHTGR